MGDLGQWNKERCYFSGEYGISEYTHSIHGMTRFYFICICITKGTQNIILYIYIYVM